MKRLISLISTEGKNAEQISKEAWRTYQNYEKVKSKIKSDISIKMSEKILK